MPQVVQIAGSTPPSNTVMGARRRDTAKHAASGPPAWIFAAYTLLLLTEYLGLANVLPFLKIIRFSTVLNYVLFIVVLVSVGTGDLFRHRQSKLFLALIVFTMLSVLWAVVQRHAFDSIRALVDYTVFFVITATVIDRRSRIDTISWLFIVTSSVLVARNLEKLTSSVRVGAFKAPYFMGDGNDFAWGLVVMLPIILNLAIGKRSLFTRLAAVYGAMVCIAGVVGTGSRGGAIGLAAALCFYWLVFGRRKLLGALAIGVLLSGVLLLAPSSYTDRIGTIGQYQRDNSAQLRLQAWRAAIQMSIDYPLGVGAGNFSSAYGRYYIPPEDQSSVTWAPRRWIAAHSIYFRVLGDYGVLGVVLLLTLIWTNLRDNIEAHRTVQCSNKSAGPSSAWPALLNASIVGYAICGVFLGGISYPHVFLLSALTIANKRLCGLSASASTPSPARHRRPSPRHAH